MTEPKSKAKMGSNSKILSISGPDLTVGDSVELFTKKDLEKRGKWSDSNPTLKIHYRFRLIAAPGQESQLKTLAFENVRFVNSNDDLEKKATEAMGIYTNLNLELDHQEGSYCFQQIEAQIY